MPTTANDAPVPARFTFSPGQKAFLDMPRKAIIATLRADGTAAQSVVYYARENNTLWISSNPTGSKANDLRADPRVSILIIADERPAYLAIEGYAAVTEDVEDADRIRLMTRYLGEQGALDEVGRKPKSRPNARLRIYPVSAFSWNIAD